MKKNIGVALVLVIMLFFGFGNALAKKDGFKNLPPGLQKKVESGKDLPPGWEKKLEKGEMLDEDVYRRAERLRDHDAEKYGVGPGEEIVRIQNKIIRVQEATRTILDVLEGN